jgi:putative ABC transport system substrate-binding protein
LKATIAESGIDAELVIRVAEQDKAKLPGFVLEARALGADLVVTYGTSVTLGIAGTLDDVGDDRFIQDIPLVFMYVADPFATRIAARVPGIESFINQLLQQHARWCRLLNHG